MAFKRKTVRKIRPVKTDCPFCKGKIKPDYKQSETLSKYLTERGRMLSKSQTGLCAKHQRQVAREIKRARHLAYMPFTIGVR